jgi:hypothetical protein
MWASSMKYVPLHRAMRFGLYSEPDVKAAEPLLPELQYKRLWYLVPHCKNDFDPDF